MRTKAIILKKQNTNEYDQLVSCYTEEFGKVTAVAKSVLKPSSIQVMHLDIFNLVDFDLILGRGMPIITGAQAEAVHPNLKNDLPSLAIAYFFDEVVDKIAFDYQKDMEIWSFLTTVLSDLNYKGHPCFNKDDPCSYLRDKQVEFMNILGYAPNLGECAFCSASTKGNLMAYSIEARGAICQDCFLDGRQGVVLKNGVWQNPAVMGALFEGLAERKLSSLNFLKNVLE